MASSSKPWKAATQFVHAGAHPDTSTGAIMTPIFQTSTYVQEAPGVNQGFEYARSQNPTRKALEEALAVLEGGNYGLSFGSGVAATGAVIKLLSSGDEVICGNDMYGGTYRLFTKVFQRLGIVYCSNSINNHDPTHFQQRYHKVRTNTVINTLVSKVSPHPHDQHLILNKLTAT